MFVVRPAKIRTTPQAVAQELGCQTRRYPSRRHRLYDYNRDFFMAPVNPQDVQNAPQGYTDLYHFLSRDKYGQRLLLGRLGVPIPKTVGSHRQAREVFGDGGSRYVVRPLRHSGGRGYRVTENPLDFQERIEYLSELYPKKREYRVIFVFGNPLITLRKKPHGEATEAEPWGHVNSTFQTIKDVAGGKLANTDFYWRLAHNPIIRAAHILAVDVVWNGKREGQEYAVLEFNTCPGIDIDANRAKVVEAIRARTG